MGGEIIMSNINWGDIGSGVGGIIGGFMGGHTPDYGPAEGDISRYTQAGEGILDPYIHGGATGQAGLGGILGRFSDPSAFYNKFAKNYQMSAGAQTKLHSGLDAVRNALAARGLSGSGAEAKALTNYTQGVINQDMQQQYNDIMGAQRMGYDAANALYGGGLNAAMRGAGLYAGAGSDIAQMRAAQAAAEASQKNTDTGSILGGLGALIGGIL